MSARALVIDYSGLRRRRCSVKGCEVMVVGEALVVAEQSAVSA